MGFLNTDSMPHLVEKLSDGDNIKITGNSKGNRVGTVVKKIVEKADDVTKAIEQEVVNDGYSFKVGTGDVDVSTDVEDGFGEIGIKGVTYQNVLPVGMFDSKENFYALGGELNNLYSSFDGGYITLNATGSFVNAFVKLEKTLLKQNSKYTLILDIKNTNLTLKEEVDPTTPSFVVASAHHSEAFVERYYLGGNAYPLKNGIQKFLLTTKSDFTGVNWSTRMFLSDKVASGSITFRYLLLEGDHTNNPNLPSYFEGIVGVGDKSKNLFNEILVNNNSYKDTGISENGSYNISFDIETTKRLGLEARQGSNQLFNVAIQSGKISKNITLSNGENLKLRLYRWDSDSELISMSNMMIEKGVIATEFEDSYDGYKIEILSYGKNLFDGEWKDGIGIHTSSGLEYENPNQTVVKNYIRVKPNTKYFVGNGTFTIWVKGYGKIINKKDAKVIKTYFNNGNTYFETDNNTYFVRVEVALVNKDKVVIISEGEQSQLYEPYQEDKTQILLDEPLMRLPNGVCDEITRDGKLIRRVGKVVLDGSEGWKAYSDKEDCWMFAVNNYPSNLKHRLYENTNLICDITPIGNLNIEKKQRSIFVYGHTANNELRYAIPKTILAGNATHLFKQWLQANPTTVYYELETPVITELPAPYLRIFKDGHLTFNTLVAPESNHVVQINKSAQIERSIREVQGLDSRVGQLESFYDDMMLETSHKLNLLTYDFEYTRERNGE